MSKEKLLGLAFVLGGVASEVIGIGLLVTQMYTRQFLSLAWLILLVVSSVFIGFGSSFFWNGWRRIRKRST